MTPIHKILDADDWGRARAEGRYDGAPLDLADGYIHLSGDDQLAETARRHFAGRGDLALLTLDADHPKLKALLRWEPSRGGALFPHLYGALDPAWIRQARRLSVDADGALQIGDLIP